MKKLKIIATILLTVIGCLTLFMSFSVSFDWFGIREMEGNYVPFVLYANMGCGFIYLFAAYALWNNMRNAVYALLTGVIVLVITFISLFVYINNGGVFEEKTIKAMTFRTVFTATLYMMSLFIWKKSYPESEEQ